MRTSLLIFPFLVLILLFSPHLLSAREYGLKEADQVHPVPIPPSERQMPTVTASQWLVISKEPHVLEGAIFDRQGALLICDVTAKKVLKITADKKITEMVTLDDLHPGGLALTPEGRLLIAACDLPTGRGAIFSVAADGSDLKTELPISAGYVPNDLVVAADGVYFSDFKGRATEPIGGVYYAGFDFKTITAVIPHMAQANGVTLSPDGRTLWATEFGRNLLHRVDLDSPTDALPVGSYVPYHFQGTAPDSMRLDVRGNVYVALYGQGRVLVLNPTGIPIANVLLPEREKGRNLLSTSLAINPANRDLFIVSSNENGRGGAAIFRSQAFAHGLPQASAK